MPRIRGYVSAKEKIEWLRDEIGWSYAEMARRSGLSPNTVQSAMARGEGMSAKTAFMLLGALRVPFMWLFNDDAGPDDLEIEYRWWDSEQTAALELGRRAREALGKAPVVQARKARRG